MSSSNQDLPNAESFGLDRLVTTMATPESKVIVLWDYENCPVPKGVSGLSVIRNIREAALKFGSIDQFEAYCDWSNKASTNIKNDLSISGVKLRDCPKKGWIGTVDKTIVVDMIVYALERSRTTTILLISGDRDHAYAISTLRNRGYPVKLIAPSGALHSGLQLLEDLLDWNSILKSDRPPTDLAHFSALARGEEEETEEEEEEEEDASEEEDEDEDEDEYEYAEGEWEEEEIETEEMAQVPVGQEAEADETAQVRIGAEAEVEESVQLQAEAEKKVQVLVETDDEGDSGEPALPTPPQSESVATQAPAETPPVWITAEPGLPSKAALLELIAARAQDRQEERLQSPSLRSPSGPQTVYSSFVGESSQPKFGASFIQQPQTVLPSYDGGSGQSISWGSFVQQPYWLPSYVGGSSLPVFGASSVQQTRTVAPSYGGVSNQPGLGASVVQQSARYRYVPPKFEPLVRELEVMGAAGSLAPSWNQVCPRVRKRCKTYLKAAGVKQWKDYLLLAEQEGLVILGGWSGKETVSLRI